MEYQIDCSIEGVAPLIQHRFPIPDYADMGKGGTMTTGAKNYMEEWREYLYTNDGMVCQPSSHIEAAMIKAAASFKITGKRGKTYKDLVSANVIIDPEKIPHNIPVPETLDTDADKPLYLDIRPVVVQRARVVRIRPVLKPGWKLSFIINILDDELPANIVHDILALAGKAVGIGDYRPKFGRFMVSHFEVVK